MGERLEEPGAEYEQPLCIGWFIKQMYQSLAGLPDEQSLADFLLAQPQHRHTTRRLQNLEKRPFAEVRDNVISAEMLPPLQMPHKDQNHCYR